MNTVLIGRAGEDMATRYLIKNGYKILKRNYRAAGGEIDIIAKRGNHLAFVEVKCRKDTQFGYAAEAVNLAKQKRIIKVAKAFIVSYTDYEDISFDVCEVYTKESRVNYIEDAFTA